MNIKLVRAKINNAKEIHAMQVEAFKALLEKYQDFDTNPGNESLEKVEARFKQDVTFYYFKSRYQPWWPTTLISAVRMQRQMKI